MLIISLVDEAVRNGATPMIRRTIIPISKIPCPMIIIGPAINPLFADSATVIVKSGPGTSAPDRAMMNDEKAMRTRLMF